MSHHNTTQETGKLLDEYKAKADSQDKKILEFFKGHKLGNYSPSEVHNILGLVCPLTSTRRSLSNLSNKGFLVKTFKKVTGIYNRKECTWGWCEDSSKLLDIKREKFENWRSKGLNHYKEFLHEGLRRELSQTSIF